MNLSKIERKKYRVRNKIKKVSNPKRYRLSVNRSIKNINALSIVRGGVVGLHKAEAFFINRIIE